MPVVLRVMLTFFVETVTPVLFLTNKYNLANTLHTKLNCKYPLVWKFRIYAGNVISHQWLCWHFRTRLEKLGVKIRDISCTLGIKLCYYRKLKACIYNKDETQGDMRLKIKIVHVCKLPKSIELRRVWKVDNVGEEIFVVGIIVLIRMEHE